MALPITIATAQGNTAGTTGVECRGRLTLAVYGTHGGGSTQVQFSPDDGTTWINLGAAITADTIVTLDLPIGGQVRLVITGGAGNSVNAKAGMVDQF